MDSLRLGSKIANRHLLGMVLITGIQAWCFTLIKIGLDFSPPLLFGGLRATLAGASLIAIMAARRGPVLPQKSSWAAILILAVVATTITFGAMFLSPGRTQAGVASALGNLQPFLTLMLAYWFMGEDLTARKAAASLLGLAGVALISYPSLASSSALGISGAVLALLVSAGSATGNLIVKRMDLGVSLITITGWQLVIGGSLLLFASAIFENVSELNVNLEFIGLLLFLSLIGTAFVIALWFAFIQEGEVGRLATFFFLVPVFGIAIAAIVFGESVGVLTLSGVTVILLAVAVIARLETPSQSA